MRTLRLAVAAVALIATVAVAQDQPTSRPVTKVACIGDSITFGVGVRNRGQASYPSVLGQLLGDGYEVKNYGVSGATALKHTNRPYDETKPYKLVQEYKPDVVVMMLGTNDSKHPVGPTATPATSTTGPATQPIPDNWARKDAFVGDYEAILDAVKHANPNVQLYLATPVPAYPPGLGGINPDTIHDEIVPKIREIATAEGATVIDLHAALSGQGEKFPDHVHPNEAGARRMAETVYQALTGNAAPTTVPAK